jgi:uncharacterized protein (DUF1697 family)
MTGSRTYVALLGGINVGGHKKVKMEELKEAFELMGFRNVKTLLASGNVLFEAPKTEGETLKGRIEEKLKKTFGHEIGVILRTIEQVRGMITANHFKGVKVTPQTRLYVTFLSEKPKPGIKIPYASPGGEFRILRVSDGEVYSVLVVSPGGGTIDLMNIVEKEFGRKVTTRNWNTIVKLAKAGDAAGT